MTWILLALLEVAAPAADPGLEATPAVAPDGVRVALRATAETWRDESIASHYRASTVVGGAALVIPVHRWLVLDLEAQWRKVPTRDEGDESRSLNLVPMSLLAEVRYPDRSDVSWFAGLGPSVTLFSERNQGGFEDPNDLDRDATWLSDHGLDSSATAEDIRAAIDEANQTTVTSGGMIGLETRVGVRVDLGLVNPPASPAPAGPVRAVELEVYGSRRWRAPWMVGRDKGFELQAWRLGVGLALRL